MKIYFFDTETTGNTEKDTLCQLAIKERGVNEPIINSIFKPQTPISIMSMSIHNITNKTVADRSLFKDSEEYSPAKEIFENIDNLVVAHNAAFDIGMLSRENITPKNHICTLKVARYLDKDEKIESYKLQYLRYLLELDIPEWVTAHDAFGDVVVLELVFERLLKKIIEETGDEASAIERMIEISSSPSLIRTFKFGKHVGKSVEEVAKSDTGYLEWLLAQKQSSDQNEEDWIYTLKHYLGK